ncbi:MAG: serine/threonine-protein kinase [Bradymonadaceae bacterium]
MPAFLRSPARMADTRTLEEGTLLEDRYELIEEIGQGGFGRVFRARQLNVDREVAIKLLPEKFADSRDLAERFEREAKLISGLRQPHTVTVHDYGRHGAHLFIVMELLEGFDLADLLAESPQVEPDRILRIARQTLKSLAEAHEHGIVHRDLKPENIFLADVGGDEEFVKILDFGVAKIALGGESSSGGPEVRSRELTDKGTAMGTPTYMSPEQAAGGELDGRSDLYALGVVMFEMACGHPPYKDDDNPANVMRQHVHAEVPSFTEESLVGTEFERAVRQALSKKKADRFEDASAFLEHLVEIERRGNPPVDDAPASDLQEESTDYVGSSGDPGERPSSAHQTPAGSHTADDRAVAGQAAAGGDSSSVMSVIERGSDEVVLLDTPKEDGEGRERESNLSTAPGGDSEAGPAETDPDRANADASEDGADPDTGLSADEPDSSPAERPEIEPVGRQTDWLVGLLILLLLGAAAGGVWFWL